MFLPKTPAAIRLQTIIEMMLAGSDKLTANRLLRSNISESNEVTSLSVNTNEMGRNFYYNPLFIIDSSATTLVGAFSTVIKEDVQKHHNRVKNCEIEPSLVVTEFRETGECIVDFGILIDEWNEDYSISQWRDEYTFCIHDKEAENFSKTSTKVRISEIHAKEIINKCGLVCEQSPVFRSGKTWK